MAEVSIEKKIEELEDFFNKALTSYDDDLNLLDFYIGPLSNLNRASSFYWREFLENHRFNLDESRLSRSDDFLHSQQLAKDFLEKYLDKVDFDRATQHGILDISFYDKNDPDQTVKDIRSNITGRCGFNNGWATLEVTDNRLIIDSSVYVHEIGHLINQTTKRETAERRLLSESISFFLELMFSDYLCEKGYQYEGEVVKRVNLETLFADCDKALDILTLLKMYVEHRTIKEQIFYSLADWDFELTINNCYETIICRDRLWQVISYAVALPLSIYMYIKCLEDENFFKKVIRFSSAMRELCLLTELLSIIGITGYDQTNMDKIYRSFDAFKEIVAKYITEHQSQI